jgi:ribosomal protein S19E (S16A)
VDVIVASIMSRWRSFVSNDSKLCVQVKVPSWSDVAKTGTHKELSPYSNDWYYTRMGKSALFACVWE